MGDVTIEKESPLQQWEVLVRCPACSTGAFSLFEARFKMASRLESVRFTGYSPRGGTVEGYTSALRLGLAYSALEAWRDCTEKGKRVRGIDSTELAARYREPVLRKLRSALVTRTDSTKLRGRLLHLESSNDRNVLPVAEAVRHLMFHGALTPAGAGLGARGPRTFLDDLTQELMTAAQARFSAHVAQNCLAGHGSGSVPAVPAPVLDESRR